MGVRGASRDLSAPEVWGTGAFPDWKHLSFFVFYFDLFCGFNGLG